MNIAFALCVVSDAVLHCPDLNKTLGQRAAASAVSLLETTWSTYVKLDGELPL
jgi:hypothetical protein